MPEGPAVRRWRDKLAPLVGEPLRVAWIHPRYNTRADALVGAAITEVRAHGKHLLIALSTGHTLHTHAGMVGSWQVGPAPLRYRKPPGRVQVGLQTAALEAVFYDGPTVELIAPRMLALHPRLRALGPDVMADDFDPAAATARVQACGDRPIGPVLLDQRVVAGIGNIYQSEGLFLARTAPLCPAAHVPVDALARLWDALLPLMRAGVRFGGPIATTPPALRDRGVLNWVYQRQGQRCLRQDGGVIDELRPPPHHRRTYWCPACQRGPGAR